ncbi:MAG: hypothetical protein ACI9Y8_001318 [Candidatus Omnitrophota bacterium]|jgi:hypothetical protein
MRGLSGNLATYDMEQPVPKGPVPVCSLCFGVSG